MQAPVQASPETLPTPAQAAGATETAEPPAPGQHGGARARRKGADAVAAAGDRLDSRSEGYDAVNERVKAGGMSHAEEAEARARVSGNYSRAKIAEKVRQARIAGEVFDRFVPAELIQVNDRAAKASLRDRLAAAVTEATERGFKFTDRPNFPVNANAVVWLNQARMMLGKLRGDKASYAEINQFLIDEHAIKTQNDGDLLRQTRKEVGEQVMAPSGGLSGGEIGQIAATQDASDSIASDPDQVSLDEAGTEGDTADVIPGTPAADDADVGPRVAASRAGAARSSARLELETRADAASEQLEKMGVTREEIRDAIDNEPAEARKLIDRAERDAVKVIKRDDPRFAEIAARYNTPAKPKPEPKPESKPEPKPEPKPETASERRKREMKEAKAWLAENRDKLKRADTDSDVTSEGKSEAEGDGETRAMEREGALDLAEASLFDIINDPTTSDAHRRAIAELADALEGVPFHDLTPRAKRMVRQSLGLAQTDVLEARMATRVTSVARAMFEGEALIYEARGLLRGRGKTGGILARVIPELASIMPRLVGDVPIFVLPDAVFDMMAGPTSAAYYTPQDAIIARESSFGPDGLLTVRHAQIMLHEAAHAAFAAAIEANPQIQKQIDMLRAIARQSPKVKELRSRYWDTDVHEFVSELFSNEKFQLALAETPLARVDQIKLAAAGLRAPGQGLIKSVLDAAKRIMSEVLGLDGLLTRLGNIGGRRTVFEAGLDLAGALIDAAPAAREAWGKTTGSLDSDPAMRGIQRAERADKHKRALRDPLAAKLHELGVEPRDAAMAAEAINADPRFAGKITDAQLRALATRMVQARKLSPGEQKKLEQAQKKLAARYNKQRAAAIAKAAQLEKETGEALAKDFVPTRKPANPRLLRLASNFQIAEVADRFFGRDSNPVRAISRLIEKRRLTRQRIQREGGAVVSKLSAAERNHTKQQWQEFSNFLIDVTMSDAHPDVPLDHVRNKHIARSDPKNPRKGMKDAWKREQHLRLAARWAAIPDDLKQLYAETRDTLTDMQNRMSLRLMENVLETLGIPDPALARRLHEGTETQADRDLLGEEVMSHMENVSELKKINGPYFNLTRRGDFVVRGTYAVTAPQGARKTAENQVEFRTEEAAVAYSRSLDHRNTIQTVYVDKNTGDRTGIDRDGTEVRISRHDTDAEARYVVTVQNRHVEFFDTLSEARQRHSQLKSDTALGLKLNDVEPRRWERDEPNAEISSSQMRALMKTVEKRSSLSSLNAEQKAELQATMNEISLRFLGSTRIQSSRLPRRYVEGASRDITRNTFDYIDSAAGYLARLETSVDMNRELIELERRTSDISSRGTGSGTGARMITDEMRKRIEDREHSGESWFSRQTSRLVSASFVNYLASPGYSFVNSLQVGMLGLPTLSAHFNPVSAAVAIKRAYSDVGAVQIIAGGVVDTARAVGGKPVYGDRFITDVKSRLTKPEADMIDSLVAEGLIDAEAGLEVARTLRRKGIGGRLVDAPLGYLENITRGLPQAVEAINRTVMAVAAYRMHFERHKDHTAATAFASELTHESQGLYSNSNAAPAFSHPVGRIALQFMKYPQLVFYIYGKNVGRVLNNMEKGDRVKGIKTLAYLTAAHASLAGIAGMTFWEAGKIPLMIFKGMGLTDLSWEDFEEEVEKAMAEMTGSNHLAEILTYGLPRVFGIDISARVGLQNALVFGEPRSNDTQGWQAFLFSLGAGAGGGMATDIIRGGRALADGDYGKAAEFLLPMKVMADTARAANNYNAGRYNEQEFVLRAFGLMPARHASVSREIGREIRSSRSGRDDRIALERQFMRARSAGDAARIEAQIRVYNQRAGDGRKISVESLRRRRAEDQARWNR